MRKRLLSAAIIMSSCALAPAASGAALAGFDDARRGGDRQREVKPQTLEEAVQQFIDHLLDRFQETGDLKETSETLQYMFDGVVAHIPVDEPETFRIAALWLRIVQHLSQLEESQRIPMLKFLRENPRLAGQMAFAIPADDPQTQRAYAMLGRLREHRADKLETFAPLAAAISIVHNRPLARQINENRTVAPDPLDIFDYFIAYEKDMLHGIRSMPVELLKYVVDMTASIEDMEWARRRYRNNQNIGRLFFTVSYDVEHFRRGVPKRVSQFEYTLPNILQCGGVCADQAYFAVSAGKSIGVPTAYTVGRSGEVGHAWVGFLQKQNNWFNWNFDTGRYEAYQRVRGVVIDPQTRTAVPDSHVALLAELINANETERQQAAAFVDGAWRLRDVLWRGATGALVPRLLEGHERMIRKADVESQLELIEAGLRISPGHARGWLIVRDLAQRNELSLKQKQFWAEVLHRLCGEHYPDFHVEILKPMIASVGDIEAQDAMWVEAAKLFPKRDDIVAELIVARAEMWQKAGNLIRAGQLYEHVIDRFANSGPFVLDALRSAERILRQGGRADLVPDLYENAWSKTRRPRQMAAPFARQSNWARIGLALAQRQEAVGNINRANAIRAMMPERLE